jgi:hypothetical protein
MFLALNRRAITRVGNVDLITDFIVSTGTLLASRDKPLIFPSMSEREPPEVWRIWDS